MTTYLQVTAIIDAFAAVFSWGTGTKEALPAEREGPLTWGGGEGTRTPNPLLAKQVRYQLRHAPERYEVMRPRDRAPQCEGLVRRVVGY